MPSSCILRNVEYKGFRPKRSHAEKIEKQVNIISALYYQLDRIIIVLVKGADSNGLTRIIINFTGRTS